VCQMLLMITTPRRRRMTTLLLCCRLLSQTPSTHNWKTEKLNIERAVSGEYPESKSCFWTGNDAL